MPGVFVATRHENGSMRICGVFAGWDAVKRGFEPTVYKMFPGTWAWEVLVSEMEYKLSCPTHKFHYEVYLWSVTR